MERYIGYFFYFKGFPISSTLFLLCLAGLLQILRAVSQILPSQKGFPRHLIIRPCIIDLVLLQLSPPSVSLNQVPFLCLITFRDSPLPTRISGQSRPRLSVTCPSPHFHFSSYPSPSLKLPNSLAPPRPDGQDLPYTEKGDLGSRLERGGSLVPISPPAYGWVLNWRGVVK